MTTTRKLTDDFEIDLSSGGAELLSGDDAVIQGIIADLKSLQGEFFADLKDGIPWLQRILIRGSNDADVEQIIRARILQRRGVAAIKTFEITDATSDNRQATITAECRLESGEVVTVTAEV